MQHTGRARVDPRNPQAFGRCDRCGFWYNLVDLAYQYEWRGRTLQNIRLRVCSRCMDVPFIFNRPIITPPDPKPVADPRLDNFTTANNGSPTVPPLPWPTQTPGPLDLDAPEPPVYVTPPLPPLPPDIGLGYPTESEE